MGNVRMTFSAEDAQAVRAFMRMESRQDALKRKQKKLNRSAGQMNQKASRGANDWAKRLGTIAAGYVGVYTAMSKARDAWRAWRDEQKEAARSRDKSFGGFRELGQVATDQQDLKRLIAGAQRIQRDTGMDRERAGELMFMLRSTGRDAQSGLYSGVSTISDPLAMLEGVSTIENALGRAETGSDKALLEKAFAGSAVAKTPVATLMEGVARVAQQSKAVGATDEELFAATALGSRGEVSVERVSTRLGAMMDMASENDLLPTNKGMLGVVRAARELEKGGTDVTEIFTSKRARQGYTLARDNLEEIVRLIGKIRQVGDQAEKADSLFGRRTARKINATRRVYVDTIQSRRIEQEGSVLNEMKRGRQEKRRQNILDAYFNMQDEAGVNFLQRYTRAGVLGSMSYFQTPEQQLNTIAGIDERAAARLGQRFGYRRTQHGRLQSADYQRAGTPEHLLVSEPSSDVPGTKLEVQVKAKDQRSPQHSRMLGVE